MARHQIRLQMAESAGLNLAHDGPAASQTTSVVIGSQIAYQGRHPVAITEAAQSLLKQTSLAGTGAREQVEDAHTSLIITLAQPVGQVIILAQHMLAHINQSFWQIAHVTSRDVSSNSRPCTIWPVGR